MSDTQAELVQDLKSVVRIVKKAAMEEQTVEVQVNRRTRIFFTTFMDHPPEPEETVSGSGDVILTRLNYLPFSYLDSGDHLLLAPLYPAVGNALIRTSTEVLIRFFDGVKSYENTLIFTGTPLILGQPAISLSFPANLLLFRRRRFFRADLPANIKLKLTIQLGKQVPIVVRLMNISPGGLAFCGAIPPDELPVGGAVSLLLEGPDSRESRVNGIVRSCTPTSPRDHCPLYPHRYGVQYDVVSEQLAARIDEMSAYAQRIHLTRTLALRARFDEKESSREKGIPREEKVSDMMKFFGIKK